MPEPDSEPQARRNEASGCSTLGMIDDSTLADKAHSAVREIRLLLKTLRRREVQDDTFVHVIVGEEMVGRRLNPHRDRRHFRNMHVKRRNRS